VLKVGKTQIRCTDVSGLLAARRSGACDATWVSARIDKFLHFMVKGSCHYCDRPLPSRPTLIACHGVNELAELELELDAVDHAFEGGLDNIETAEHNTEKCNIHEDDADVDGE
jgi:hypothetical protein